MYGVTNIIQTDVLDVVRFDQALLKNSLNHVCFVLLGLLLRVPKDLQFQICFLLGKVSVKVALKIMRMEEDRDKNV